MAKQLPDIAGQTPSNEWQDLPDIAGQTPSNEGKPGNTQEDEQNEGIK